MAALTTELWVTAHRSAFGQLVLMSWLLKSDGTITLITYTVGYNIDSVSAVAAGTDGLTTAVRRSPDGELVLQRWHVNNQFISERMTSGSQGSIAGNVRMTVDAFGNLVTAVLPSQQGGRLRLTVWQTDERGRFRRCDEGGGEAGEIVEFDIAQGPDARLVTAARTSQATLTLDLWQTDRSGRIVWLGDGSDSTVDNPALPALAPAVTGTAPVVSGVLHGSTQKPELRLATWRVPQGWNFRLRNVDKAFRAVSADGHSELLEGGAGTVLVGNHIQGMAMYKHFVFLTKNVYFGDAKMFIASQSSRKVLTEITTPNGLDHPAASQVIGDHLALAVESNSSDRGLVRFYNLTAMSETNPTPQLLPNLEILRPLNRGAGAVGVTDVGSGAGRRIIAAIYDRGSISFYRSSKANLADPGCTFGAALFETVRPPSEHLQHVQNISLVTSVVGDVYLVVFATTKELFDRPEDDWLGLYRVDLDSHQIEYVAERHMYTDSFDYFWTAGIAHWLDYSVHFRWGAGLTVVSDAELAFFCSQRNFTERAWPGEPPAARINLFRA
ncbi:MAG: hypothetical protein ACRD3Q_14040 [Terriglobales bacterium]